MYELTAFQINFFLTKSGCLLAIWEAFVGTKLLILSFSIRISRPNYAYAPISKYGVSFFSHYFRLKM